MLAFVTYIDFVLAAFYNECCFCDVTFVGVNKCPHIIYIVVTPVWGQDSEDMHGHIHIGTSIGFVRISVAKLMQEYLYRVGGLGVLGDNFLNFRLNHSGLL